MTDYHKLTVVQIRELFKTRNIPTTGLTRKQQLIDRLLEDDTAGEPEAAVDATEAEPLSGEQDDAPEAAVSEATPHDAQDAGKSEPTASLDPEGSAEQSADATPAPAPPTAPQNNTQADLDAQPPSQESAASNNDPVDMSSISLQTPVPTKETSPPDASMTRPEAGQDQIPVSASPSATTSPSPDESRKRKRRSATPPMSEEEVLRKKAKQEEDGAAVVLQEDVVPSEDSKEPTAVKPDNVDDSHGKAGEASSDMKDEPAISPEPPEKAPAPSESRRQDTNDDEEVPPKLDSPMAPTKLPPGREKRYKDLVSGPSDSSGQAVMDGTTDSQTGPEERDVTPALHPATSALYIRDFMRPLRPDTLEAHLASLANPGKKENGGQQDGREDKIRDFHLDTIRTHCFAVFTSVSAASRVRSAIHERVWPPEGNRKPLWADFIPEDKVQGWIEREKGDGAMGRGSGTKRWEVVYDRLEDGTVQTSLEEATAAPVGPRRSATQGSNASGAAPSAPAPQVRRESSTANAKAEQQQPASFLALDSLFKSTSAKPKLYFMPVSKEQADRRLDELDALTSRHNLIPPGGSGYADSRRYTFENGDKLVDNGPEFGLRQVRPPPRGYRGR